MSGLALGGALPGAWASGVAPGVGDVYASVADGTHVLHFNNSGGLLDTLNSGLAAKPGAGGAGLTFDTTQHLYVTQFANNLVSTYDSLGNLTGTFGGGYGSDPESILTDAAGNFYVGQADGSHHVLKFDSAGNPLASYAPAPESRGTDWIDLSADQCTLLYTSEGHSVKRFDVCTNTQLSDFATGMTGTSAYALRIRPNGEVLVADTSQVYRFDPSGSVIQTYPLSGNASNPLFALNLDSDESSFWTANEVSGDIYKVDIASGTVLQHFNAGAGIGGLAVFGELEAAHPKLLLAPTTATQLAGTSITLTATLQNVINPAGTTVTFTVTGANPQTLTSTANGSGIATVSYTGTNTGTDQVVASATTITPPANVTSNTSIINWTARPTTLVYNGDTTPAFHDPATLAATLTDTTTSTPIANKTVAFTMGSQSCTGVTDGAGTASCTIIVNQAAGAYTATASFAGDNTYQPSSDSSPFTVTLEETTTTYTGPTLLANGQPVTLSGVLKEDAITPISGRTLTLTLGSGAGAQSCTGTTDASGSASCTIAAVNQALGAGTVTAAFAGDSFYLPSSASANTLVFAFLAQGSFVIGDHNAAISSTVTFWDAQWNKLNALSGGNAPASFKGFASTPSSTPPTCGSTWTSSPGNSAPPAAGPLPEFMAVIVSSHIAQTGPAISGDIAEIVIVHTNPGYQPNPGHAGTGTILAVLCHT